MTGESTNPGSTDNSDSAASRGNLRPSDAPTLGPRPVYRPHIDSHTAHAFRRPNGQTGSFAPHDPMRDGKRSDDGELVDRRPPDGVLAEAFARPEDSDELLQREPDSGERKIVVAGPVDPWRDPAAGARLGAPAIETPEPAPLPVAPKLSAREVLFGSRVAPKALALLAVIALGIAVVGGLVGRITAETASTLTSRKVTLQQSESSDSPHGKIAAVADAVLPSVVSIQVIIGDGGPSGSGVVLDAEQGYIVTNNHVISAAATDKSGNAKIQIEFSDNTRVPAQIVGRDPKTDLAVLKVDADNLTEANLGRSDDVQVGDDVLAIGSPLGLEKTVTSGIVSALHRPVSLGGEGTDTNAVIDAVQTDASINPGNSGGALVDMDGRLIGVNTAIKSNTGNSVGLGFAIPIDVVTSIAQTLIRDGKVNHPQLGLSARTKAVANELRSGAAVADVVAGGPAAKAGIVEGDVIVKVGDRVVEGPDELVVAVQSHKIGERVNVQLIRDGRQVDVPVTLESD
ncbi:trypsin-like peptidase domain-containing protein [Nocardia sp. NPDC050378]|uniref:S1C family serine protease n=1 Tax=Nocardia sp. NPDC050378 TaxID=3155400 RepID=UPI0033DA7A23